MPPLQGFAKLHRIQLEIARVPKIEPVMTNPAVKAIVPKIEPVMTNPVVKAIVPKIERVMTNPAVKAIVQKKRIRNDKKQP